MKKMSLTKQLIYIILLIIGIIFIALGLILPKELLPIYEENIYNKLREPLHFAANFENVDNNTFLDDYDIAYIYQSDNSILTSYNIGSIINKYDNIIINYLKYNYGKFIYKGKLYYYYKMPINNNSNIISITNDSYLNKFRKEIIYTIFIVVGLSFVLSAGVLVIWSNNLVNNIKTLEKKIKNLDNYDKVINMNHHFDDEIASLNTSIDSMREYLKSNEVYKNQTYQSISHDFKTPIAVIKSYIEASEDGIETKENSLKVIKEQINNLENKVHSLLYLNKLNYLKDNAQNLKQTTNISKLIIISTEKFKNIRPELTFKLDIDKKMLLRGTPDMWEAIIDNLLNNFMRYAKNEIKITAKNKRIILFNDGDKIDPNILNNIFTPYEKGLNGMFGFGLSIVKKTLELLNYSITVSNVKNGVTFTIK